MGSNNLEGTLYNEELDSFLRGFENPFSIFQDDKIRKEFFHMLALDRNGFLFDFKESVEYKLMELEELYSKGKLYRRWSQIVDGKRRHFSVPNPIFRKFLDENLVPWIKKIKAHPKAHGAEKSWSVKKSLEYHIKCMAAFSFDLEDAFDNISISYVFDFFYNNLHQLEYSKEISGFLSILLTTAYKDKRSLPQGSSHSMALFNRILHNIDDYLDRESIERGFTYTRWVDDMTISSCNGSEIVEFLGAVRFVEKHFPVSKRKIFFQRYPDRIFLLGHRIENGKIIKNSREEREKNKALPLDYESFFDEGKTINYKEW